jgi:S-adenosylmethionine hydrolase
MAFPIVTLTSDFGLNDPYVAEMKAVILGVCPRATVVDVSHGIEKFNVRMAAYVLASAAPYFPRGTVHVAVVDPGVGTRRRPIVVQAAGCCFVGPDNGVLALAVRNARGPVRFYRITNREFMLPNVSGTFHGRDVFAPVAAHLANGVRAAELGRQISRIRTPGFAEVTRGKRVVVGEVVHVDDFGNVVTNLGREELRWVGARAVVKIRLGSATHELRLCRTYADVERSRPLALVGSHGFLEVSVNQGHAANELGVRSGDRVVLYRP